VENSTTVSTLQRNNKGAKYSASEDLLACKPFLLAPPGTQELSCKTKCQAKTNISPNLEAPEAQPNPTVFWSAERRQLYRQ
jgi:hypothetical protein